MFRRRVLAGLALPGLVAAGIGALSGTLGAADPRDGYRLAKKWCTSCHLIAPGESGSDAARPFPSIAADPNFTGDGIRAWLVDPHPPMPNLPLSRDEIEQIVAYLESLRP